MPGHVMPNSVLLPPSWPLCQAGYQIPERGACKNIDPPPRVQPRGAEERAEECVF